MNRRQAARLARDDTTATTPASPATFRLDYDGVRRPSHAPPLPPLVASTARHAAGRIGQAGGVLVVAGGSELVLWTQAGPPLAVGAAALAFITFAVAFVSNHCVQRHARDVARTIQKEYHW